MKKQISRLMALALVPALCVGLAQPAVAGQNSSDEQSDYLTLGEALSNLEMTMSEGITSEGITSEGTTSEGTASEDSIFERYIDFTPGFNQDGTVNDAVYDYKEGQITEMPMLLSLSAADEESGDKTEVNSDFTDPSLADASTFDLRHVGGTAVYNALKGKNDITGGTSYVTPVKLQNPWGTCWAFGIVAAAETSILSELRLGTTVVNNTNIDLSEHHLAWFAKNHIPAEGEDGFEVNDVANQDGEGKWYFNGTDSSNMSGGSAYMGASVFAAGMGIVDEDFAPYYGDEQSVMVRRKNTSSQSDYPERYLYYDSLQDWEEETDQDIKDNYSLFCYSDQDDWTLDESMRFYQSYALEETNILPNAAGIKDKETGEISLNVDGINAVKQELVSGKAVEASFFSDASDPNKDTSTNTARYISKNYAHFTWDKTNTNHSVCIVGWDDDYDASNFGVENPVKYDSKNRPLAKLKGSDQLLSYTEDEEYLYYIDDEGITHTFTSTSDEIELVREEDGSMSVPPGNGAWIVKNSWGATSNDFPNYHNWGTDGTGYFYISYYDTSLSDLETYDFAVTDSELEEFDYTIVDEYDYMTANTANQYSYWNPCMMANVFVAEEDMQIEAVSCQTTTPGTTAVYTIVLMDDDETCPSETDKVCVMTDPVTYKYGGYHREQLEEPVKLEKGQKYAVIVQENYYAAGRDGNIKTYYALSFNVALSQAIAEKYNIPYYSVGIVNPGESFILERDSESGKLSCSDFVSQIAMFRVFTGGYEIDNFSIKAYATPLADVPETETTEAESSTETIPADTSTEASSGAESSSAETSSAESSSAESSSADTTSAADTSTEVSSSAESDSADRSPESEDTTSADRSSDDQPGTGDHTQVVLWMTVSIAALAGITVCVISFKSRKEY